MGKPSRYAGIVVALANDLQFTAFDERGKSLGHILVRFRRPTSGNKTLDVRAIDGDAIGSAYRIDEQVDTGLPFAQVDRASQQLSC